MKTITSLAIFLFVSIYVPLAAAQSSSESITFSFTNESQIYIDGTSSLHDWTCEVEKFAGEFNTGLQEESPEHQIESGMISINPDDIECGKRIMNGKLRKALASDVGSEIVFTLEEAQSLTQSSGISELSVTGSLIVAGMSRPITFSLEADDSSTRRLQFEGSVSLLMSDFGVKPPKALLGRLKTGDEVTIRFIVVANQTPLTNS